ncbi:MAG: OmpA family protein [Cytophagales bacterium]|nr:OmpA family protein [Cytophagales bacterium]
MKQVLAKYSLLFLLYFITYLSGFSQLVQAIERQGDQYFQNNQYVRAITMYKTALEENPNLVRAEYKLGESYRLMLDYESAEYYYQSVAETRNPVFPLAGFYYGLMQKQKGKYSESIRTLKAFGEFLMELGLHEDDKYRYFHKQAKIEIDGCQLALNQITLIQPDHSFEGLPTPLNSEFSDYAAFSIGSDSILCLTSAREGGKGSLVDNQFGESYADLFRFVKEESGWTSYDPGDRFDQSINTRWGDGSGSFNKDRTKFYYTNCDEALGDVCHIFVAIKRNGRWTESIPLNFNINEIGSSSKHPNLTLGGDTLFYVTDKDGGYGGLDIWMSINAGGDNWGPSVNLGDHINTPFNEVSPFYNQAEKVLFFGSDGHRGFGGYDIYIARGNNFKVAEIYNAGQPFNSNSDDIFFFLGNERGYLSSNREDGLGKFDIYGFNIKSKQDIISSVSTEETIAGRNSLFTEDYNFDSREPEIVNQIISRILSSSFSEIDLLLTEDQLEVYNSLSQDDKDRIDKIVKARLRKMTNSMLRSVRSEDDFYYQDLDTDKRLKVDEVVTSHLEQRGIGYSVILSSESTSFYNSIDTEEREKVDILLTERIKNAENYKPLTINYASFDDRGKEMINVMAGIYLEQKKGWQSAVLRVYQRDFWKTSSATKPYKVNSAIRECLLALGQQKEYKLTEVDRDFYEKLSEQYRKNLNSLASTYLMSDFDSFEEIVNNDDLEVYGEYGTIKKKSLDRILLKLMSNMTNADIYRAETFFSREEMQAGRRVNPDDTYNALQGRNSNMTDEDKLALRRFVRSSFDSYLMTSEPIYLTMLPVLEIVAQPETNFDPLDNRIEPVYNLGEDVLAQYGVLSESKRKVIDKLIGLKYINRVYDDPDLQSRDASISRSMEANEKRHVEILSKGVRGDELTPAEQGMLSAAFTYYNAQSKRRKALLNRIVLARTFNGVNGNFILNRADAKVNGSLTLEDRELLGQIKKFRFSNERILTENMAVESKDVDEVPVNAIALVRNQSQDEKGKAKEAKIEVLAQVEEVNAVSGKIILDIPTQDITKFMDLVVSGQLRGGINLRPLAGHPISLREHDKEKTVIDMFTDTDGNFAFHVPVNDYHFITEQIEGNSDIRIRGLKVEGRRGTSEKLYANRFYFDVGSFFLREETKKMLDEVIDFYKQNRFRIEIESHADNTGGIKLNLILSKNRGNSALDYMVSRGVVKSDVSVIWHGEGKPIASNNSPFGRQLNRRLDIRMISDKEMEVDLGEIYLTRPDATMSEIASSFQMTVDKLKEQNGLSDTNLRSYQPIRVKNTSVSPDFNLVAPTGTNNLSNFVYKIQPGEGVTDIATKFNVPEELILELNGLRPSGFTSGKEIKIYPSTSE